MIILKSGVQIFHEIENYIHTKGFMVSWSLGADLRYQLR